MFSHTPVIEESGHPRFGKIIHILISLRWPGRVGTLKESWTNYERTLKGSEWTLKERMKNLIQIRIRIQILDPNLKSNQYRMKADSGPQTVDPGFLPRSYQIMWTKSEPAGLPESLSPNGGPQNLYPLPSYRLGSSWLSVSIFFIYVVGPPCGHGGQSSYELLFIWKGFLGFRV